MLVLGRARPILCSGNKIGGKGCWRNGAGWNGNCGLWLRFGVGGLAGMWE
jgi:hypothetical protein